MKRIIIAGASGMVGGIILREALNSIDVSKVTSITRKPSGVKHPKLIEVIHKDFLDFSSIESHFKNQDIAHFCIGVYTGAVPDDKFKIITVDFAKSFSDVIKANSPKVNLCFLSGSGADQTEKSRISFAKYKGMAENYLISKELGDLHIFRPAYIYPVEKREEPNFTYRLSRRLYPLLKKVYPSSVITSEQLGKGMFQVGMKGSDLVVLENVDIKKVEV